MYKYKSVKTGAVITTASVIHSDNWIEEKDSATEKPKKTKAKKVVKEATAEVAE